MTEVVEYVVHRPDRQELVVQLSGGGAAVGFISGMKAKDAIHNLRLLADRLERGLQKRATGQEPDIHFINKSARGEA